MRPAIFFTLIGTGFCWAVDAKDEAELGTITRQRVVKEEMAKLQGTWKVVKVIDEGKARSDEEVKKRQVVIAGDKITVKDGVGDWAYPIVIAPGKKPATIDFTVDAETNALAVSVTAPNPSHCTLTRSDRTDRVDRWGHEPASAGSGSRPFGPPGR
jgi:uncharacterized protein (TIGR03067 family)